MARILLAMIIGGGVLIFLGVQEMRLASGAKQEPASVSCSDLIRNGPGDNAHILLKDFFISPAAFVYESAKSGGNWKTIWVPVVPQGGAYHQQVLSMVKPDGTLTGELPVPTDIRVIVKSSKVATESDLDALADQETLQGVIVNKIASLGGKEKKILTESYPTANFDNVYILEHDRKPASAGKSYGMMGGGGVLAVLGVLGFFRSKQS